MEYTCEWCGNLFTAPKWKKQRFCNRHCSSSYAASEKRKKMGITLDSLLEKAKIEHNDFYNYENVVFTSSSSKVSITCPRHGRFMQSLRTHSSGRGCPSCAKEKQRKTTDQFIREAKEVHGDRYDYSLVDYKTNSTHIIITCDIHGEFKQLPYQHVNLKSGCPECKTIIRQSQGELDWLSTKPITEKQKMIIINGRRLFVDGYDEKTNTVYEYLGDYWHGNPDKFNHLEENKSTKLTFGELYDNTFKRFELLKKQGYNIIYKWESGDEDTF